MNADGQYWLFEDPYQCCKKYFGWDEDSCISSSIQGLGYVQPPSSPNVALYYSCRICFSDCPQILNNLDNSIPIIGDAIFSAVCNGNCNTGDSVQFDSVCGQSVDIDVPYSGNRRLKEGRHGRRIQTVVTPCIEFTIKIHAQSESEAAILYNQLYLLLGTSPTQFDTLQSIQSYIQMMASTSLPVLSTIVIDGYSHITYSVRHFFSFCLYIYFFNSITEDIYFPLACVSRSLACQQTIIPIGATQKHVKMTAESPHICPATHLIFRARWKNVAIEYVQKKQRQLLHRFVWN